MSWRIVAVVGLLAVSATADAQKKSIGTIIFGNETFEIVGQVKLTFNLPIAPGKG